MQCAMAGCDRLTAAEEFCLVGPLAEPAAGVVCLAHLRQLVRNRRSRAERERRAIARTLCGRCGEPGLLYPSGTWCPAHLVGDSPLSMGPRRPDISAYQAEEIAPPILAATACPVEKLPTSVKSMLKALEAASWDWAPVTYAVSGEGLESVLLRARKDEHHVVCRWECRPGTTAKGKPYAMGFVSGFYRNAKSGWPTEIGFQEAVGCVKSGVFPDERASLLNAIRTCMDALKADILTVQEN